MINLVIMDLVRTFYVVSCCQVDFRNFVEKRQEYDLRVISFWTQDDCCESFLNLQQIVKWWVTSDNISFQIMNNVCVLFCIISIVGLKLLYMFYLLKWCKFENICMKSKIYNKGLHISFDSTHRTLDIHWMHLLHNDATNIRNDRKDYDKSVN